MHVAKTLAVSITIFKETDWVNKADWYPISVVLVFLLLYLTIYVFFKMKKKERGEMRLLFLLNIGTCAFDHANIYFAPTLG